MVRGPYDLSLVEGSVTTPHDAERIREVRRVSRKLVTIGACATAGGIQALRNFGSVEDFLSVVYASPEYVSTLETSTPISAHVNVDFELHGCPIDKRQLLEVISAFLAGPAPAGLVCGACAPNASAAGPSASWSPTERRALAPLRMPVAAPSVLRTTVGATAASSPDGDAEHRFTHAPAAESSA